MTTFGAPAGAAGSGGHHGVDSSSPRPTTPSNSPGSMRADRTDSTTPPDRAAGHGC